MKGILKHRCSWNFKTYDILEFQEQLYSRTPFNFHNFKKHEPRGVLWKTLWRIAYNFSKILVKYLWRNLLFVNLQAYSLQLYQIRTFSQLFFKDFPYICFKEHIWMAASGLLLFTCLLNTNKKRVLFK